MFVQFIRLRVARALRWFLTARDEKEEKHDRALRRLIGLKHDFYGDPLDTD
jgi:hypothetical protein